MLIVVSGLPGTGKTVIAEEAARIVGGMLVSKDIVEAALRRNGIGAEQGSGTAAYDVLFRELAARHDAGFKAVECVCSDPTMHRARLEARVRGIPGWRELSWADVGDVAARYEPWSGPRLMLDAVRPLDANLRELRSFLAS